VAGSPDPDSRLSGVTLPPLSGALLEARHSGIREIGNLAAGRPGCIRLEAGQPDFKAPAHVAEAAKRAIDEGWTSYTHTAGLPGLRERLAGKLRRVNGIPAQPDQVVCGPGGVGVIYAALAALCNPGDEVLLPDPHWPNYTTMAAAVQARAAFYPCPAELGFLPDLERLEGLVTARTRVLVVNSPNNPTGAVYPPATLAALAEIARRHGLWLVSDECYDQIVLDGRPVAPSLFEHAEPGRVISAFTFSKTYAMTGWRLGYAAADPLVSDTMVKVLEATNSCPSTVTQKAGEAALDAPQDCVAEMVAAYRRRRDLVVDLLREAGLLLTVPEGAFYVLADVSPSGLDSRSFALRLLHGRGVGVAPGSAMGGVAAGAVRISLASSDQDLREGVGRLCELVAELAERRA
jgi:aspartate/methionine/tyrosine aminotransferase